MNTSDAMTAAATRDPSLRTAAMSTPKPSPAIATMVNIRLVSRAPAAMTSGIRPALRSAGQSKERQHEPGRVVGKPGSGAGSLALAVKKAK